MEPARVRLLQESVKEHHPDDIIAEVRISIHTILNFWILNINIIEVLVYLLLLANFYTLTIAV